MAQFGVKSIYFLYNNAIPMTHNGDQNILLLQKIRLIGISSSFQTYL